MKYTAKQLQVLTEQIQLSEDIVQDSAIVLIGDNIVFSGTLSDAALKYATFPKGVRPSQRRSLYQLVREDSL